MVPHDPEQEPPDDAVEDRVDEHDHLAGLLELTDEFFRQASPQVRAERALFLTTQHRWSPECGFHAYLDSLSFTAPRTAKSDEEQHAVTGPGVRPARLRRTGGYW
ncbi:hypothetical protein ACVH9Z_21465 [Rhodococcus opacus]|uniref:Uncharacterized protein n=1 Tax=Rhodococcus opacus TaxID=37919 RepID=A0A1B1KIQ1_RHOOP|nr:hypothetical protein [Rhodococcus opacus]ANS32492.1 hypothetical protein R1CP_39545 [Rhodococcus opacus]